jgi:glycosyltransferase involved in cell wall biosynthesis
MLQGNNIICFSNDWNQDPLSKHHIMSRLAKHNRILWINSIGMRRPTVSPYDIRKIISKMKGVFRGAKQVQENLYVITPLVVPFHGSRSATKINRILLIKQVYYHQRKLGLRSPILWSFLPNTEGVFGAFSEKLSVYYITDDFSRFEDYPADRLADMEKALLEKADLTFCVSNRLFEKRKSMARHIYLMRHGVDYAHFTKSWRHPQTLPADIAGLKRPILGFWGELNESLDYELLRNVAESRPAWSVVLIGSANIAGSKKLPIIKNLPNVYLLGSKDFSMLPQYAAYFDIALLPKNMTELSLNMNPLKLREYLAAGVPVVSAPLPEVLPYGDVVKFAETSDEVIKAVEEILKQDRNKLAPVLSRRVADESWDAKVEEISGIIEKALRQKGQSS